MEESLRSEVLELKLKLKEQTVIVEEYKQTSHEMKLKVTAAELMRDEAMSEADSLQESLTKVRSQYTELDLKKNKEISLIHKQSHEKLTCSPCLSYIHCPCFSW
uniref:Uncharacterized protein n=1 Tax=Timema genevievae TaxID=629358 RepID=A0A7R9K9R7_TIMGE|nr:unnamed protein product [Timema genevievae]